ncbi:MAG: preprotein translocase subunit SecG [Planctomycetota bacterium]
MNPVFVIALIGFIVVSTAMILIILVQRPSGGGLAGAFGGAGGTSSESVFGGRVGDVLTNVTIGAFVAYLALAVTLSLVSAEETSSDATTVGNPEAPIGTPLDPTGTTGGGLQLPDDMTEEDRQRILEGLQDIQDSGRAVPEGTIEDLEGAEVGGGTFDPTSTDGGSE